MMLKQEQWRVKAANGAREVEIAVPVDLRQPAAGHTVTVAFHDPVSGLSGIASEQIGGDRWRRDG